MTKEPLERLLTAEEYSRLPEDDRYRDELVRGRVVREPSPGYAHGRVQSRLLVRLWSFVEEPGLGYAGVATGFIVERGPDTVRGPDVYFVSRERLGDRLPDPYPELGPDGTVALCTSRTRSRGRTLCRASAAGCRTCWSRGECRTCQAAMRSPGRSARSPVSPCPASPFYTGIASRRGGLTPPVAPRRSARPPARWRRAGADWGSPAEAGGVWRRRARSWRGAPPRRAAAARSGPRQR